VKVFQYVSISPSREGSTRFPASDPVVTHPLIAQAHMPPTELVEVAGFTGTVGTIGPRFDTAGVARDLEARLGPIDPVLARLDVLLRSSRYLSEKEFASLVAFVKDGLLDPRARRQSLCQLLPASVPSGRPTLRFEGCPRPQ
jgi:hypothetical protein